MILESTKRNTKNLHIFRTWSCDVLEVKNLFHDRKYRRCAARCEELLAHAVHPLHRTFLNFYQALCYESLGVAAHMFSTSKIEMLELAREKFGFALENLPLPFDGEGHYDEMNGGSPSIENTISPACATLDIVKRYQFPSPLAATDSVEGKQIDSEVSPADTNFSSTFDHGGSGNDVGVGGFVTNDNSPSISSTSSPSCRELKFDDVPDFDAYSPRRSLLEPSPLRPRQIFTTQDESEVCLVTPVPIVTGANLVLDSSKPSITSSNNATASNHKARLSQSLSSTHCLADDLVPSPLFNRISKVIETDDETPSKPQRQNSMLVPVQSVTAIDEPDSSSTSVSSHEENQERAAHGIIDMTTPLKPHNNSHDRPLPPLPFNHKPHFEKRGSRHILIPSSHLALTIANAASDHAANVSPTTKQRTSAIQTLVAKFEGKIQESKSYSDLTKALTSPLTPVTPRFQMISRVFKVHNHDSPTVAAPVTPQSHTTPTPSTIASTTSNTNSNMSMNLYLASFHTCLRTHMTSVEARISKVTELQSERKKSGVARSMSFWSFDVTRTTSGKGRGGGGCVRN